MSSLIPLLVIFLVVIAVLIGKHKYSVEKKFDEREQVVRGQAYRYAFTAMIIFEAAHIILLLILGRPMMADGVSSLLAIFLSIGVFAAYCIFHDAFKQMQTKKGLKSYVLLLLAVVLLNGFAGWTSYQDGSLVADGILQMPVSSIACAATFLIVLICLLVKQARDRQEAAE
ncbi:MAG: hypothetical protein J5935_06535 [Lachnospiraceae bacterium]|nr:hypothetical protein [Lachnospiraceae bacterium]